MSVARRPSVGLDFGTSTTLVASAHGVIPIGTEKAATWMPSLVGYDDDGALVTAEAAASLDGNGQVIRSIKRLITGNQEFVQVDLPAGRASVRTDDLIVELLREAERRGSKEGHALTSSLLRLGCPAMWDARQRRRLLMAAQRAGLPVQLATMVDEPVAAGIAWLAANAVEPDRPLRIVVFDMGGGTLDIAVLHVHHKEVAVLAALGIAEAGDALDDVVAADLEFELTRVGVDVDVFDDPRPAREQLRAAARTAKEELSGTDEHVIILSPRTFGRAAEVWYSREQLNDVFQPQMDRAEEAVELALKVGRITELAGSAFDIARMSVDELVEGVDVVLLSGGMSHIPYVRYRLRRLFGGSTRVEPATKAPEEAVALGLARAGQYGRINVFRPPFDILLEWDRGKESRTIYEAFEPLVGRSQIAGGGDDLRYVRRARDLSLPRSGKGRLRVVSHSGERLRATMADRTLDGFPVNFADDRFEFSIYPDGRIRMVDGAGIVDGRVEDWHRREAD